MPTRRILPGLILAFAATVATPSCLGQSMPATAGETLSGQPIVLAEAVRGHATILVAGFSHEAGMGTGDWVKALQADPAFAEVPVFQVAMLEPAPAIMRGMIKSGMRKGLSAAQQDHFVVLTQDEKLWQTFFDVTTDKEPYVVLVDASGKILWHGHGAAAGLESQLKGALN